MKMALRLALVGSLLVLSLLSVRSADAAGVTVGASSLIRTLDYSDTFTGTDSGGRPNRAYQPAVQPAAAYVVENTYGNPSTSFNIGSGFSFAADGPGMPGFVAGSPTYPPGPNASGAGSNTGFTQAGQNVDYAIPYNGLRSQYIVQVDAVQVGDRIDISSGAQAGIFSSSSLSVFFRGDGSGNASLFNGTVDTPIQGSKPGFNTGITGPGQWNNYAVRYDIPGKQIELFVNQNSVGVIDLTTFAGGIYQNFTNQFVGAGGGLASGENRVWTDNFQVGVGVSPVNPPEIALSPTNLPFGEVTVGANRDSMLTVSNVGASMLTITSLATNNPVFRIVSPGTPFDVPAGTQAVVTVRFTPTNASAQTGTLSIVSTDSDEATVGVALSGSGVDAGTSTCTSAPPGLVAWYRGENTANDSAGTKHGTLNGTVFGDGKVGRAFSFDGVDDDVLLPTNNVGSAFTVELWFFATSSANRFQHLVSDAEHDAEFGSLFFDGNNIVYYQNGTRWIETSIGSVLINQWTHVALTFDGSVTPRLATVFINGSKARERDLGPASSAPVVFNNALKLGYSIVPEDNRFKGLIDEVSIYNRALSSNEIAAIFAAGGAGKCETTGLPDIALSATNLHFGNVNVGQQNQLSLIVSNIGAGTLTIQSITTSSPIFSLIAPSPAPPLDIPAGGQRTFTLQFAPQASGTYTGSLDIANNDLDEPVARITLTGSGLSGPLRLNAVTPQSGAPGNQITLSGANFGSVASNLIVRFGGATGVLQSLSSTQIIVSVPFGVVGSVPVSVTLDSQTSGPGISFEVLAFPTTLPRLNIARDTPSSATVFWAASLTNYLLEAAPGLGSGANWSITEQGTVMGDRRVAAVPLPGIARYMRLRSSGAAPEAGVDSGESTVRADTGGIIVASGNSAALEVPPRALTTNTPISLAHVVDLASDSNLVAGALLLAPDGLSFQTPATIKIQLPQRGSALDGFELYLYSRSNPPVPLGSEISLFQAITNYTLDPNSGRLTAPISHFSALVYVFQRKEPVYIVFDLDGKYLRRGDLLYALTHGGSWFPGHTGLYMGNRFLARVDFKENDGDTIVESTPKEDRLQQLKDGVQYGSLAVRFFNFKVLGGQHIYLGARRPRFEITDQERYRIAQWAAIQELLGVGYATAGGPFLFSGSLLADISCVGLTEGAYESIGKSIVPGALELFLLPLTQFNYTRPIDSLTIGSGSKFEMPVYAVVKPPDASLYTDSTSRYIITMEADPDSAADRAIRAGRARFQVGKFTFEPNSDDGDLTPVFRFHANAPGIGQLTQRFFVTVTNPPPPPIVFVRQEPTIHVDSQSFSGDLIVTNNGAYITAGGTNLWIRWTIPPPEWTAGQFEGFNLVSDVRGAAPRVEFSSTSQASPRRLYANMIRFFFESDTDHAFVGYKDPATPCPSNSRCYALGERSLGINVQAPNGEFSITHHVLAFGGLSFGGSGERYGSITWRYVRKP